MRKIFIIIAIVFCINNALAESRSLKEAVKKEGSLFKYDGRLGEYKVDGIVLNYDPFTGRKLRSRSEELFTVPSKQEIDLIKSLNLYDKTIEQVIDVIGEPDFVTPENEEAKKHIYYFVHYFETLYLSVSIFSPRKPVVYWGSKRKYFRIQDKDNFKSIGIVGVFLDDTKGNIEILKVGRDTPADRASLHYKDKIIEIDGAPTNGLSSDDVYSKLRGPVGSKIKLSILSYGKSEPSNVDITLESRDFGKISWKREVLKIHEDGREEIILKEPPVLLVERYKDIVEKQKIEKEKLKKAEAGAGRKKINNDKLVRVFYNFILPALGTLLFGLFLGWFIWGRREPETIGEDESFIALMRFLKNDEEAKAKMLFIFSQNEFNRQSLLNSFINELKYKNTKQADIEAVSYLLDDDVALRAQEFLEQESS